MRTANDNEGIRFEDEYIEVPETFAAFQKAFANLMASTVILPKLVCEDEDTDDWGTYDSECDCPDCTRPRK